MLLKVLLVVGCVAAIQAATVPLNDDFAEPVLHVLNDAEMDKFLADNPQALKLTPKLTPQSRATIYGMSFELGGRQTGDVLVYKTERELFWFPSPSDPQLFVKYPSTGTGKIVTYLYIHIQQSNIDAEAFVTLGGIGQRKIEFYVRGYNTELWSWDVKIYGKD